MKLRMVAWEGYGEILRSIGVGDYFRHDFFEELENGQKVVERIENSERWELATIDREHLSRVGDGLGTLPGLGKEVLASALPRLSSLEYYGYNGQLRMLPVRFGMNGVVYTRQAKEWLVRTGCLRWNPASVTEVIDLVTLLEHSLGSEGRAGGGQVPDVYRWGFDSAVRLMLRRSLRNSSGWEQAITFEEAWDLMDALECIETLEDVIRALEDKKSSKIVIGPGDNACGPARVARGDQGVEWTVAQGAGLLWLEGIAVNAEVLRDSRKATEVESVLRKIAQALQERGFEHCCPTAKGKRYYWGLPVLGWRDGKGEGNGAREDRAGDFRNCMRSLGYDERVEGFLRLPPEAAMGQFLDGAGLNGIGIALRGFPSPWDVRALKDGVAEGIYPDEGTARRIVEVQGERLQRGKVEEGVLPGLESWAKKLWKEAMEEDLEGPIQRHIFLEQKYGWSVLYSFSRDLWQVETKGWDGGKDWNIPPSKWIEHTARYAVALEKWESCREGGGGIDDRLNAWLSLAACQIDILRCNEAADYVLSSKEFENFLAELSDLVVGMRGKERVLRDVCAGASLHELYGGGPQVPKDEDPEWSTWLHDLVTRIGILRWRVEDDKKYEEHWSVCERCRQDGELASLRERWEVTG